MNNLSERKWLLIATVFAVVLTVLLLSGIVTQPWHVMPELGADGGKNMFTFLYHVLYEKGLHFGGMNYPYGEHIVYTDAQPILSVPLSYLHPDMPTALAIMWWFISASYVLAIVYCYRLLRHFGVAPVLAMLFAGLIIACSPQVLRLSAHYALSFCCLLPMLFYWTLKYNATEPHPGPLLKEEGVLMSAPLRGDNEHTDQKRSFLWPKLKYCVYMWLMGCFTVFLHPYYGAVGLIWAAFYSVGYLATGKGAFTARIRHIIPPIIASGLVMVVFGLFMKATDQVTDRPAVPYGVLDHVTHIKDIFSSGYSPLWAFVKEHSHFSKISYGGEGFTYVGLVAIVAVLVSLLSILSGRIKNIGSPFPAVFLLMALLALLLGAGAPFTWGMAWLLKYASALRQFRTLGRFSWIYYYIVTIYAAVVISRLYERYMAQQKKSLAYGIVGCALAIWTIEATGYTMHTHEVVKGGYSNYDIFTSRNDKNWEQLLAEHHLRAGDFQGILVLPFFATGSEKLWVCSDENISAWSVAMGVKAGLQLHLPIMDIMLSRSSWGQTFKQVKIAGGPYTDKPTLREMDSSKLLLALKTDGVELDPDQQYLLTNAVYLGHYLHCTVYGVDPQVLQANDLKLQLAARAIARALPPGKDTCIAANGGTWFVNHYDESNYNATPFGTGALAYSKAMGDIVCDVPVVPAIDKQQYEFSCWFHVPANDYRSPKCVLELINDKGAVIRTVDASTIESTDNEASGPMGQTSIDVWLRCSAYFPIDSSVKRVRCRMLNFAEEPFMAVDELMLRPATALIIGHGMANNHFLKNR